MEDLNNELATIDFVPMSSSPNSPLVALFGDHLYGFNSTTETLLPKPFAPYPVLSKVLDTVCGKLGVIFNSILVNKYRTKNVTLGWHKDLERVVDQTFPIAALSVGASRRFQISDSKEKSKRTQMIEIILVDNSLLIMKPGLQNSHFHRIVEGRNSGNNECGVRHSLTFRRLLSPPISNVIADQVQPVSTGTLLSPTPHANTTQQAVSTPPATISSPVIPSPSPVESHINCTDTLVFGSSLTRDLDMKLLSKRGKTFKVFTKGGARVETVIKMIRDAVDNKEVCTACVSSVFLIVGGNDVENIQSSSGLEKLKHSYKKLIGFINSKFPSIRINNATWDTL